MNSVFLRWSTSLLALVLAQTANAAGRYYEVSYPPSSKKGELEVGVTYTVWLPDGVDRLRGVIVHQHGCGTGACKGGETAAYDLHWQALAKKWDCALLGPSYHQEEKQNCRLWCDPRNGSRQVFLNGLHDLAQKSNHPELEHVPWCLWGHSGGGFWASLMQTLDPERIVAIWFRSGTAFATWEKGEIAKPEMPPAAYEIPMMANPGAKENGDARFKGAWDGTLAMFKAYRAKGAPIGFAPDPRTAHECGDSRYLAIPFFDACLAQRLPEKGSTDQKLKPVDQRRAWLAEVLGNDPKPVASYEGKREDAVWLPDERVARAWAEYVKTGAVSDATPPPAPSSIRVSASAEQGVEITWDAAADFESGLRAFVVQRDGKDLAQVPEKPLGRFGLPLFQAMSYHDTPEAPVPALRFVDKTAKAGEKHEYRVIAVNAAGLKSDPSVAAQADKTPAADLPKVVLIGDSIRLGYAPKVAERLAGKAVVISPAANGGDSANVLAHLDEWVIRQKPDVVHLNSGLHDLKRIKADGHYQVTAEQYEANLRKIVARIRDETHAALVFANTTPIVDERHAKRKADFDRLEADVRRYNAAAATVLRGEGIPIDDLHWVVEQGGPEAMLGPDGTHYTPAGSDRLAEAVADCILRQLTVVRYRPLPKPAAGPEAAAKYEQAVTERDRQVPEVYRRFKAPAFPIPESADAWKSRRPGTLRAVVDSLGDLPPRPSPQRVRVISRELRRGYTLEKVAIDNGVDGEVTALLLVPEGQSGPVPAILWLHSSTPDKTQVIIPNTNGGAESLGETFVKAGYAVLAPDSYWHGDRAGTGPSGAVETDRGEQESLLKWNLWFGRTLWGMMVRDDQIALDYLCSRPEVDKARVGATGMSMGSTRAWWLAAVDDRVAAVVGVACLTRYQNLIAHGELRAHGVYYFVNGLLKHFDTEGVLALIAPRPFLALTGELDAGSPADGVRDLERIVGRTYGVLGAGERYRSVLYPEVGHSYTPQMRAEMLAWFERWLHP